MVCKSSASREFENYCVGIIFSVHMYVHEQNVHCTSTICIHVHGPEIAFITMITILLCIQLFLYVPIVIPQ